MPTAKFPWLTYMTPGHDGAAEGNVEETLRRALRTQRMLSECNQLLIHATDETQLTKDICRTICEVGGYTLAWVGRRDYDQRRSVTPVTAYLGRDSAVPADSLEELRISWDENDERGRCPMGRSIRSGQIVVNRSVETDKDYMPWRKLARTSGILSAVAIPLLDEGHAFAVLGIYATVTDVFDPAEVSLLEELGSNLAFGIRGLRITAARDRAEHDRELAKEEARESHLLLQMMIENTPAAVAMFDSEIRYVACSRRWLYDFQLGERDLKGLSHYAVFPEIGEDWKAVHRRCLAGATESREEDIFVRPDGKEDIVRWVVQPWRKSTGEIGGIVMFTEVITERKRAEKEFRTLEAQLRQSQKMEALGTLAGGIAHDFNNLLAVIGNNAELGRIDVPTADIVRNRFDEIIKACAQGKDIVKQILLFSRRQPPDRKVIRLEPAIEDALKFLRATLSANIQVRTVFEAGLSPVSADASQIYQVIMNLGTNAAYAMSATGGVLTVSVDRINLDAGASRLSPDLYPGAYVRMTVRDTGTGMSRKTLERLFEPFFTTKGNAGTGLGLSVVHGIIKEHGGAITVESIPFKGTTFEVYLPAVEATPVSPQPEPSSLVRGSGERVMYVDDDESLTAVTEIILERLGYRCTVYTDARVALEAFRANPDAFDAAITDMTMPAMTGLELANALRAIRPDVPVAIVSGRWEDVGDAAAQTGVAAWLNKPASIEELSVTLHALLHQPMKQN